MQALRFHIPQIYPIQHDFPLIHIVQPHDQVDQGGFPCAGSAHQPDHLPGLHLEIDVLQHRFIGVVAKGHSLEIKGALDGKFLAVLPVLDYRFFVKYVIDTVQAGDHLHDHSGQMGHPAQRAEEVAAVSDELYQLAQAHFPVQHVDTAEVYGDVRACPKQKRQYGEKDRPERLVAPADVSILFCLPFKAGCLPLFLSKGLHHTHAGDDVLEAAGQVIRFQPLLMVDAVDMVPERPGHREHHNDEKQGQQCHLPTDHEHYDQRHRHGQQGGEHVPEHFFHEAPDLVGIPGDAVEQFSRLAVVDERKGQGLYLVVELAPQAHAQSAS